MRRLYRRILIPTDGSRHAAKAIKAGVALARALGARVNAVYVANLDTSLLYGAAALYASNVLIEHYADVNRNKAKKALAAVARAAKAAGVAYGGTTIEANPPWRGILRVAGAGKCDAIVMASHGRSILAGLMLGSQTAAVLAHSKIPVLVIR